MFRRTFVTLTAIATLALPLAAAPAGAQGTKTEITFSLDFVPLGRHAPWYVALGKGYYAAEGLDVKIIAGKGTAQVFQALESGLAQIAFADVAGTVLARAGGSTAKMVAVNYQKAPYAIFSLDPGANVTRVAQLSGLEIASSAGSFTPAVIRGFMRQHGLDPASAKFTNVDGAARVGMLLSRNVPAIETFIFAQPGIAGQVQGASLRTFLLADHGLDLYANGVVVQEAFLKARPQVVRGFLNAALKGWRDALRNPEEAADIQARYVTGLQKETAAAEIRILRDLAVTADTKARGLGWFDPARMKESILFVLRYAGVKGRMPTVEELASIEFLPEPPVLP